MSCARAILIVWLLSLPLLLTDCDKDNKPHLDGSGGGSSSVPSEEVGAFDSFDSFNEALAKRVTKKITETASPMADFLVVAVQGGAYPIGTLLRQSPLIPVAAAACLPPTGDKEVMSLSAPTLFPTYSMTRKVAGNFGLDEAVFEGIAKAGLSAAQESSIDLSVSGATLDLWTDYGLTTVLSTESCRKALKPDTTHRLVRGLVKGTRKFIFGLNRTGEADLGITQVANFKAAVTGDGSTMTVSDLSPEAFVMVVSEVKMPPTKTEEVKVAVPSAPPVSLSGSKIYVQRDAADSPDNAKKIVELLKAQQLNVASLIEAILSNKMPSSSQVRYFRAEDEAKAEQVLSVLKKEYPQAKLVALRIPAPEGQLEVWLSHVD